jgi:hypothetical protein
MIPAFSLRPDIANRFWISLLLGHDVSTLKKHEDSCWLRVPYSVGVKCGSLEFVFPLGRPPEY